MSIIKLFEEKPRRICHNCKEGVVTVVNKETKAEFKGKCLYCKGEGYR